MLSTAFSALPKLVAACVFMNSCDSRSHTICPWNSPGKNTGVGCHSLPGLKLGLLHCRQVLCCPGGQAGRPAMQNADAFISVLVGHTTLLAESSVSENFYNTSEYQHFSFVKWPIQGCRKEAKPGRSPLVPL